jgi:hypothetical protein
MRTILGFLAAAALSAPLPAAASDWWRAAGNETSRGYVDLDSLSTSGGWVRAQHMLIYRQASPSTKVKRVTAIVEFDCSRRISRYRQFIAYDETGGQLHNLTDPDNLADHAAEKGTIGGDVLDFVCGIGRERAVRVTNPLNDQP